MANYYPPVAFHFKVEVLGLPSNDNDVRFTEVTGLSMEMATEEVPEGGENRFVQKFPTRARYTELVLKRGLLVNSEITEWVRRCIEDMDIEPKSVDIKLLNEQHQPLLTWHLVGAYPTKWSLGDLNASNSAVSIESLQLYYQRFTMDKS
ncbi:phage tail tube protein gp19, putative [Geotalea daltonii FRC-32]|uniref:Phage tail tube protein gp19, putative n=1 Tax=Geotalea daltonii (strain DSM 22248 / JCM 15807 / FRC-32) TaxID=316067 RepID=B9M7I5_GEODF|nr:phage tail protein [Geotalea daltonii]ACM22091.1 phage tail tube protein gp19, putative [Geotalea daltonii FRC-32]